MIATVLAVFLIAAGIGATLGIIYGLIRCIPMLVMAFIELFKTLAYLGRAFKEGVLEEAERQKQIRQQKDGV